MAGRGEVHALCEARHAVLLSWLPGRQLDRSLWPLHLRHVGELMARMQRAVPCKRD
jgi:Ser/Thr protein kinase RdoA (MazF antagonist)